MTGTTSRARRLLTAGLTLVIGAAVAVVADATPAFASGPDFAVTTTADVPADWGACGDASITGPDYPQLSLREATCLADNVGGTVTIAVPAGHYTLTSGQLTLGRQPGQNVTVEGAGAGSTVIDGAGASRVLRIDAAAVGGVATTLDALTITGGLDSTTGGGAISAGSGQASTSDTLTITDSALTGNSAAGSSPTDSTGYGGAVEMLGGQLTLTDTTVTGNTASVRGSGIDYRNYSSASPEGLTATGSTFSDNTVATSISGGIVGGTIYLQDGNFNATPAVLTGDRFIDNAVTTTGNISGGGAAVFQNAGPLVATGNTFTGNSVTGPWSTGAVLYGMDDATLHYNRIVDNSSTTGYDIDSQPSPMRPPGPGYFDANENWWGCNGGPNQPGCDGLRGPFAPPSTWLTFAAAASPSQLTAPNATATITGSLTSDNTGAAVDPADLTAFDGTAVSFADPPGDATVATTPGAHTVALAGGQASIGYHSNTTTGPDNVDVTLDNQTATAPITVDGAPSLTSADTAHFTVGTPGSFTVTTAGYPAAALTETGALPAGVTFADNGDGTATIAGTPATASAGSYPLTLTATNGIGSAATQTLTVDADQSPAITSADHVTFTAGQPNTFTVNTTPGYPSATTLSETGALPTGVRFTDNGDGTATLSGYPAPGTGGSWPITVHAAAPGGSAPDATQTLTLTVNEQPTITSADHAVFTVGTPGSFTVTTSRATPATTVLTEAGALPAGVTFTDNGDGTATLAGTPAAGTGRPYNLTLTADNGVTRGNLAHPSQSFTLAVTEPALITSADHVTFDRDAASSFAVTTGHTYPGPVTLTDSGTLPPNMTFTDNGDGTATLSGYPAVGGVFHSTITASTGTHTDSTQAFTATVDYQPTITSADHAVFTAGTPGSFTMTTTAGLPSAATLAESAALPAGVTFTDNGDGTATFAGTPAAGTGRSYPVTLTADNGVAEGTLPRAYQSFALVVNEPAHITSAARASAVVGQPLSFTVTATGAGGPIALTETGALPGGVTFTDNGDGTATLAGTPAAGAAGRYDVHIGADNGVGTAFDQPFTLTVDRVVQTITVTSPDPGTGTVGGTYAPAATSDSGLPVTYSLDAATTNQACSLEGSTVFFDHAGSCVVDITQPGNGMYAAADPVQVTIAVDTLATAATVTTSSANAVYGQQVTATAAVTAAGRAPAGDVQFAVDGTDTGAPVGAGGTASPTASSGPLGVLTPGLHTVTATFTPTDPGTYAGTVATTTLTVSPAGTATAVEVGPHTVTATVAPAAPGSGAPTGTVSFSLAGHAIGTAALAAGTATLTASIPPGATRHVAAVYSGDGNFTASSGSTARHDPRIVATVTSRQRKSAHGWYRTPVTVTFTCTANGAPLTGPCPGPVTLTRNGAGRSLTRTVTATDGGAATVTATGINIDQRAPRARIVGARNGAVYAGSAPSPRCVGTDRLSGVLRCALKKVTVGHVTRVYARVVDRAGNVTTARLHYRTLARFLAGARYRRGAFDVRPGHTYTLTVSAARRPRYLDAAVFPRRPGPAGPWLHRAGPGRWTLGVTIERGMRTHPLWRVGVQIGDRTYMLKVRVI